MSKLKKTSETKYFFTLFISLMLYAFVVVNGFNIPKVEGVMYVFHCVDYGLGFCSKFLPGTVYRLFFANPSELSATVFELILLICFFAVLSFYITKLISKIDNEGHKTLFLILAFFLTGPCTFSTFSKKLGMLDVYWVFFSVLFFALLQNRYLRLILPIIGFFTVSIHFGALICYVPFFALLILYELSKADEKKDKIILGITFALFCVCSIGAFAYFGLNDVNNIKCNIDEFNAIISARGSDMAQYFSYEIFGNGNISLQHYADASGDFEKVSGAYFVDVISNSNSIFATVINAIVNQVTLHISFYTADSAYIRVFIQLAALLLLLSPVIYIMYKFILKRMKLTVNKTEKFVYLCMMLFIPVCSLGSIFVSTDTVRWLNHIYIALFSLILYMIYKEKEEPLNILKREIEKFNPYLIGAYTIIYFFAVYDPYV